MIKTGRMKCSIHGNYEKCAQNFCQKTCREETTWTVCVCVNERIILKWTLNSVSVCGLKLSGSEQRPVACCYEYSNELLGSIKAR
jgi:hypothetical protein